MGEGWAQAPGRLLLLPGSCPCPPSWPRLLHCPTPTRSSAHSPHVPGTQAPLSLSAPPAQASTRIPPQKAFQNCPAPSPVPWPTAHEWTQGRAQSLAPPPPNPTRPRERVQPGTARSGISWSLLHRNVLSWGWPQGFQSNPSLQCPVGRDAARSSCSPSLWVAKGRCEGASAAGRQPLSSAGTPPRRLCPLHSGLRGWAASGLASQGTPLLWHQD